MNPYHILMTLGLLAGVTPRLSASPDAERDRIYRQAERGEIGGDEALARLADTAIVFHGRVVDQFGAPVAAAEVVYSTKRRLFGEEPEHRLKTDSAGEFTISGRGLALDVEVSKSGYRKISTSAKRRGSDGRFEYAVRDAADNHRPEKSAPVVFLLRKVGPLEPLVRQHGHVLRFSPEGKPGYWSLHGPKADSVRGAHRLEFSFISNCPPGDHQGRPRFDWSLVIKVEDGGLVEQEDADGFEAPEGAYRASDRIVMRKEAADWRETFPERSYYVRFADGVHARIDIEGRAVLDSTGSVVLRVSSRLNTRAGSRNLEEPLSGQ